MTADWQKLIAEARALCEKATPGPWRMSINELGYGCFDVLAKIDKGPTFPFPNTGIATVVDERFSDIDRGSVALMVDQLLRNAEFIAASRTLVPQLTAALDAAIKEIERLKDGTERDHPGAG